MATVKLEKKTKRTIPTPKQQKVLELIKEKVGNGEGFSKGQVLREAGYAIETADKPGKVFDSKNMREALSKIVSQDDLSRIVNRKLNRKEMQVLKFPPDMEDDDITASLGDHYKVLKITEVINMSGHYKMVNVLADKDDVNLKALDIANKMFGHYVEKEDGGNNTHILIQVFEKAMEIRKRKALELSNNPAENVL